MDSTLWLKLFLPFTHVTLVRVSEKQLVPSIMQALVTEGKATAVLPKLFLLHLEGYTSIIPPVAEAAKQFVATRRLSGHTVFLSGRKNFSTLTRTRIIVCLWCTNVHFLAATSAVHVFMMPITSNLVVLCFLLNNLRVYAC